MSKHIEITKTLVEFFGTEGFFQKECEHNNDFTIHIDEDTSKELIFSYDHKVNEINIILRGKNKEKILEFSPSRLETLKIIEEDGAPTLRMCFKNEVKAQIQIKPYIWVYQYVGP